MTRNPDKVISASRRTDIPAFYMDWFMEQIRQGVFTVQNPYNKIEKKIDTSLESVHSIVFWSKNYAHFLTAGAGEELTRMGYHLYFNFTINSESELLEPNLPPLRKRLDQLDKLASTFGPETISWRFDPICFFRTCEQGNLQNNLSDFPMIAHQATVCRITKCVTSFFDPYPKIERRAKFLARAGAPTVSFMEPTMERRIQVIQQMEKFLTQQGIDLYLCCEREIFSRLDPHTGVRENSCVDGKALKALFKGHPETKRDYGQRSKQGCGCTKSIDIGSYADHPCFHNCLFCYANPDIDNQIKHRIQ